MIANLIYAETPGRVPKSSVLGRFSKAAQRRRVRSQAFHHIDRPDVAVRVDRQVDFPRE